MRTLIRRYAYRYPLGHLYESMWTPGMLANWLDGDSREARWRHVTDDL